MINPFNLPLYFRYLAKLYLKNLMAILFGLAFAFAAIDYFQHSQKFDIAGNYKILYVFYMWQEALGLLYPLAIVFALIMTKLSLVKHNTMGALHAFGYSKRRLLFPLLSMAFITYIIFTFLHTTEFSYAKDKAMVLLKNELNTYEVNDLFFKYNDTFVYVKKLNPIEKIIEDLTIFKVENFQVRYTIYAPYALYSDTHWNALDATLKKHVYEDGIIERFDREEKETMKTLVGYKPKIIESLYEGKALNIVDAYNTWRLLDKQGLNSDKIRASLYDKVFIPLFSLALLLILFFKLPFHARMANMGAVVALALGSTFAIWGIIFGLNQVGANGVLIPELTAILPVTILWVYALYVFFTDEKVLR